MEFFNSAIEVLQTLVVALGASLGEWVAVEDNTPVSMNMWGFTPDYFEHSEEYFKGFLADPKQHCSCM